MVAAHGTVDMVVVFPRLKVGKEGKIFISVGSDKEEAIKVDNLWKWSWMSNSVHRKEAQTLRGNQV